MAMYSKTSGETFFFPLILLLKIFVPFNGTIKVTMNLTTHSTHHYRYYAASWIKCTHAVTCTEAVTIRHVALILQYIFLFFYIECTLRQ
jgi:hypothetical protein